MKSIKKKGLTIVAMIMMMGFTTAVFAQVPETQQDNMGTQQEQETFPQDQNQQTLPEDRQDHMGTQHMGTQEDGVIPQEQNQLGDVDYEDEIEQTELPATVTTSLETMYPDHDVEKVYRGTDNSYKVKVKNGDEKSVVYYDANGTFVKEDDGKHKDKNKDEAKEW
jgi:hypothetical protein